MERIRNLNYSVNFFYFSSKTQNKIDFDLFETLFFYSKYNG